MEDNSAQLIEKIAGSSGMPSEEVQQMVADKRQRFAGLLTDSGAALMVAKELGVDLQLEKQLQRVSIGQLQDGMQGIDLLVRVMHVFSPKAFEKNGKRGQLCNLVVGDKTGETRLTLWHNDVRKMQDLGIERGSTLLLQNCYVNSFNGKPQLNLSYNGRMIPSPTDAEGLELPEVESKAFKLSELSDGLNDVSAVVRILRVFPENVFEKDGGQGRVMNFLVGDETATLRATAWNDMVGSVSGLRENDLVKVEGAYTKHGMRGIELHLGWRARIIHNPCGVAAIPTAPQLLHESVEGKKVSQLDSSSGAVALTGKIAGVNQGQLRYNVCPKCGGKAQKVEDGLVCDKCGEVKEPDIRPVISVVLDDGSGQISAVAYGETAELIIGMRKDELKKALEGKQPEEIIAELQQKLGGKPVKVTGNTKENPFSGRLELTIRSIEF